MIEFRQKHSLANGNKINKKNWHKTIAKDSEPCLNLHTNAIDKIRKEQGVYHCEWHLKKEPEGYIFREINSNTGINGHHKTYRRAVFSACKGNRIRVFLPQDSCI